MNDVPESDATEDDVADQKVALTVTTRSSSSISDCASTPSGNSISVPELNAARFTVHPL